MLSVKTVYYFVMCYFSRDLHRRLAFSEVDIFRTFSLLKERSMESDGEGAVMLFTAFEAMHKGNVSKTPHPKRPSCSNAKVPNLFYSL